MMAWATTRISPRVAGTRSQGCLGWERQLGPDGAFVGMTGFGGSAPYQDLYLHFGITAEAVAEAARAKLQR